LATARPLPVVAIGRPAAAFAGPARRLLLARRGAARGAVFARAARARGIALLAVVLVGGLAALAAAVRSRLRITSIHLMSPRCRATMRRRPAASGHRKQQVTCHGARLRRGGRRACGGETSTDCRLSLLQAAWRRQDARGVH